MSWDLSQYDSMSATFGIPNGAPNSTWVKIEVRITGDNGQALVPPFFVQVGSPRQVEIPLNGTINFKIECGGVSQKNGTSTGSSTLAIGDGALS